MTVKTCASIVRVHLLPAVGTLRLEDVTNDMVEEWLAEAKLASSSRMKVVISGFAVFVPLG